MERLVNLIQPKPVRVMEPSAKEEDGGRPRACKVKIQFLLHIQHPLLVIQVDIQKSERKRHVYKLHHIQQSKLKVFLTSHISKLEPPSSSNYSPL